MRKKRFAGILAGLLVLMLVMAACGGSKAEEDPKRSAAGTYVGTFDMTELLNEEIASYGVSLDSTVSADFILKLQEDETYTFDIERDSLITSLSSAVTENLDSIISGMMGVEISEDMKDTIADMGGYENYDAFKDAVQKEMLDALNGDALDDLTDLCHFSGTYSVQGDQINLGDGASSDTGAAAISLDSGKIQDDGSILISSEYDGKKIDVTFGKR